MVPFWSFFALEGCLWRTCQNSEILRILLLRSTFSALNSLLVSMERIRVGKKH